MTKKCPHCKKRITFLKVSKQIEGTVTLSDLGKKEPLYPIQWRPPEEQYEPEIFTCPVCQVEIDDEILIEWGLKDA